MPIRYRIDTKQGIVYNTSDGILTDDDLIKFRDILLKDADFHPSFKTLSDFRSVDNWEVSASAVRRLTEGMWGRRGSQIALVTSFDVTFGMSRMYQMLAAESGSEVKVFEDMVEARKWLGLE